MKQLTTYSFKEAYQEALLYFNNNNIAAQTWVKQYAMKDGFGEICDKTPKSMHWRMANELERIEKKYKNALSAQEIFNLLNHFKYLIPHNCLLFNPNINQQTIGFNSNFIIGLEEPSNSYGAMMHIDEELVQLLKRGGKVGIDLNYISPVCSHANNTIQQTCTNIVSLIKRYSYSVCEMAQKDIQDALTFNLCVKHPDCERFIEEITDKYTTIPVCIAIKIDDDFMRAVVNNSTYTQQFPVDSNSPIISQNISAKILWKKLIRLVCSNTEHIVLLWENIQKEGLADCYSEYGFTSKGISSCSSTPLSLYETCQTLSINLLSYVENPFTNEAYFDIDKFESHVKIAQRLLDDMVDLALEKANLIIETIKKSTEKEDTKTVEYHLWQQIKQKMYLGRRTGLNITAERDMLKAMRIYYGTKDATDLIVRIHQTLALTAYQSSVTLAQERGAFNIFNAADETNNLFLLQIKADKPALFQNMQLYGRRNISCLGITTNVPVLTQLINNDALSNYQTTPIIESNIDCLEIVKRKGAIQQWVDHNMNVCVTIPQYADEAWLNKIYMEAWKNGCKGCTVKKLVKNQQNNTTIPTNENIKTNEQLTEYDSTEELIRLSNKRMDVIENRPKELECDVVRFQNNKEKWVAFVGLLNGYPYEIFTGLQDDDEGIVLPKSVTKGKIIKHKQEDGPSRYDFQFQNKRGYKTTVEGLSEKFNPEYWNYAKLISGVLRYRMPIRNVIKLVSSLQLKDESINTWKVGVERALKKYVDDGTEIQE